MLFLTTHTFHTDCLVLPGRCLTTADCINLNTNVTRNKQSVGEMAVSESFHINIKEGQYRYLYRNIDGPLVVVYHHHIEID